MKKLFTILFFIITLSGFLFSSVNSAEDYRCGSIMEWNALDNFDIGNSLDACLSGSKLVNWENAEIWDWFGIQIKQWTNNISLFLWILAVGSIILGAFMLTVSTWEDEKIKKAKDIVKWWIIWFLWIIFASAIINLIIKIMYSI